MSELVNIADQFQGLPMDALIGGPLQAAIKSNAMLAETTADFIKTIGFYGPGKIDDGKGGQIENPLTGKPRMVNFEFQRPGSDADNNRTIELVKMRVPMLAIVPIPNLQIDTVDIRFNMTVKSSFSSTSTFDTKTEAHVEGGGFLWVPSVDITGTVSSHSENVRKSDNSAKYRVEVKASNQGTPEGLARVLDIMADAAKPLSVVAFKQNPDGSPDETKKAEVSVGKTVGKDDFQG